MFLFKLLAGSLILSTGKFLSSFSSSITSKSFFFKDIFRTSLLNWLLFLIRFVINPGPIFLSQFNVLIFILEALNCLFKVSLFFASRQVSSSSSNENTSDKFALSFLFGLGISDILLLFFFLPLFIWL